MFPLLYVLSLRKRYILPSLAMLAIMLFAPAPRDIHTYFRFFYLGALIPRLGGEAVAAFCRTPRILRTLALVLALVVLGWFERISSPEIHMAPLEVFAMTLAATFIVGIVYHGRGWSLLRSRFLLFVGEISYGIYLIHFGVLFVLSHLLAPRFAVLSPPEAIVLNLALGTVTLLVTILLATFSYYSFERPCQRLGRRLSVQLSEWLEARRGVMPPEGTVVVRHVPLNQDERHRPPAE